MSNLVFKRLTVASDTLKSANEYTFSPRFNLITANDNSLGKSTIAKLLCWTVGCEPELDSTWQTFDIRAIVEFDIENQTYEVARHGNEIFLKRSKSNWGKFPKITGAYSKAFAQIVGFNVLLPNRNDATSLESPPPAYYFLPFYVDQKRGWNDAWDSFSNLGQYAKWQSNVIQFHTGYLTPDHFDFDYQIALRNAEKKAAESEVKKIETALEVVNTYVPATKKTLALSATEFDELSNEVNDKVVELQQAQEKLLSEIATVQSERVYLQGQLDIVNVAASELEADYRFSIENIPSDTVNCPLCGTTHNNIAPNRAAILADKDEAHEQFVSITKRIGTLENKIDALQKQLIAKHRELETINRKYTKDDSEEGSTDFTFLESLASKSVQRHVQQSLDSKTLIIQSVRAANRKTKSEQRKLLSKARKDELDFLFQSDLSDFVEKLKAPGVNLSPVKSPLDHRKLFVNGGAAESTRGMLAYYFAVLRKIHQARNEVFSTIIIDTPNQQEQANEKYISIIDFIMQTVPTDAQLILCGMNRQELDVYRAQANVIELDEKKILDSTKYEALRPKFSFVDAH